MSDQAVIGAAAFECHRRIVEKRAEAEQTMLELAAALYDMKRNRYYRQMGHPTMESYIADPEVGMSRSLVYRLLQVHEKFVLELESPPDRLLDAGHHKLSIIAPHVTPENQDDLLELTALSITDMNDMLQQMGYKPKPYPVDYRRMAWLWKQLARKYYRKYKKRRINNDTASRT
jgi:hypothetical protein